MDLCIKLDIFPFLRVHNKGSEQHCASVTKRSAERTTEQRVLKRNANVLVTFMLTVFIDVFMIATQRASEPILS